MRLTTSTHSYGQAMTGGGWSTGKKDVRDMRPFASGACVQYVEGGAVDAADVFVECSGAMAGDCDATMVSMDSSRGRSCLVSISSSSLLDDFNRRRIFLARKTSRATVGARTRYRVHDRARR
jgi:hypothetical protein